jgi:hypothetical protein
MLPLLASQSTEPSHLFQFNMATPTKNPTESSQPQTTGGPNLTNATDALTKCRTINAQFERDWNALTMKDYEAIKDGTWNRKWDRRMKQREKLVDASVRLDFYVKFYLKKRNAGDEDVLKYLDEAGMGYMQSR